MSDEIDVNPESPDAAPAPIAPAEPEVVPTPVAAVEPEAAPAPAAVVEPAPADPSFEDLRSKVTAHIDSFGGYASARLYQLLDELAATFPK